MTLQDAIRELLRRADLTTENMISVMRSIMTGEATAAQIGGFLVGLRAKGEAVHEIAAAATVMRELATSVAVEAEHLVDTCGTGGDGARTFNISTTAAFVVAGAGGQVAKHGNRSVSSRSGSADVLEQAGVRIDLSPEKVARCIREVGVGFMFAPLHHGAMRYAIGPRRELGVRTLFNLLGPLTNPAGAPNQLVGVFANEWVEPLAQVLRELGSRHVMVVNAEDGMDEISTCAPTHVAELRAGEIRRYVLTPEVLGFTRVAADALGVDGPASSLSILRDVLSGRPGPARDIVLANAGAALYVAGLAVDLPAGIDRARRAIDSGAAAARLDGLISLSQRLAAEDPP